MIKDEMDIGRMVIFHITSALNILEDAVEHNTVDTDVIADQLYDAWTDSDDDMEQGVWQAVRRYLA